MTAPFLGPPDFFARFQGRHFGKYRAIVTSTDDPRKCFRVRVRCPSVYGNDESPWAEMLSPFPGSPGAGFAGVPDKGSLVWVEFEEGRAEKPIVVGGLLTNFGKGRDTDGTPLEDSDQWQANPNTGPSHAVGNPDGSDFDGGMKGMPGVPPSAFGGKYPHVRIWQSPAGHFVEMDDTPGAERVQISHKTGAHVEIRPDGSIVVASSGKLVEYAKSAQRTVDGNQSTKVRGSSETEVGQDVSVTLGGKYRVTAKGEVSIASGAASVSTGGVTWDLGAFLRVRCDNGLSLLAGSDANFAAMQNVTLSAGGTMALIASNAMNPVDQTKTTWSAVAQNGRARLEATDLTGQLARVGIEMQAMGVGMVPLPTVGVLGPFVRLGSLRLPASPAAVPLLQEPAVLGMQLHQYLMQLQGFLQAWLTDYLAHTHPWFSPPVTSPAMTAALVPMLQTMQQVYLTPVGPKVQPLIHSDIVFFSKD